MDLLQYRFRLPAAHDMASVRQRIRERHAPFDAYPGLRWKAFLVREAGVEGATDNQYAPVYAWRDPSEAARFLAGPLFRGVTDAFGWVAVESWIALGHRDGPARAVPPLALTRATRPLGGHAALVAATQVEVPRDPRIHSVWRGLDARRWEQVELTLWAAPAGAVAGAAGPDAVAWEVAHLSEPAHAG